MSLYHAGPNPAADLVVLQGSPSRRQVLLVQRGAPPARGGWALPGGFVSSGAAHGAGFVQDLESPRQAAIRELAEETGLHVAATALQAIGVFDRPGRDPRGDVVSHAFLVVVEASGPPRAGDDAAQARWFDVECVLRGEPLPAFDHPQILRAALAIDAVRAGAGQPCAPLLRDHPAARWARKRPVAVQVVFAEHDGSCATREGPVRYRRGDAVLRGGDGESWPVERARFDRAYAPVPGVVAGQAGAYVKLPLDVVALRLDHGCAVRVGREGDPIRGRAGDWLVQYGQADYGIVAADRFEATYALGERVLAEVCRLPDIDGD